MTVRMSVISPAPVAGVARLVELDYNGKLVGYSYRTADASGVVVAFLQRVGQRAVSGYRIGLWSDSLTWDKTKGIASALYNAP